MGKRYVARIVVEAVEEPGTPAGHKSKYAIANVVVGAATLPDLIAKTGQHIAIIEDGGSIEDRTTRS